MFKALRKKKKGQSVLEYTILLIIVVGAFVGISNYLRRGLMGRWKVAVDDVGEQYDPRTTNASIRHSLLSNTESRVVLVNDIGGYWTLKTDIANTVEIKTGHSSTATYE